MSVSTLPRLVLGLGLGTVLAYTVTPAAIWAAERLAFYDKPAGYKGHTRATPYLGGTAVMLAFVIAAALGAGHLGRTLPLLGGVIVLLVVGTIDDRVTVSPRLRVAVELALGALVSVAGIGWRLGAGGAVDAAVTAVWVVGVVNAFNLFDNMDGAASTMAFVVSAGACALALVVGDPWVAVGCAALCGACLGFLPHNLSSPARIFLGDGGSMPLGFAAAVLVANAARSAEPSSLSLLVGFLLVGIPALDTSLVIISRRRRGISILTGGRDHLTHRTRQRMGTSRRVAAVLGGVQALISALVILASRASSSLLIYVLLAFVVCAAAAIVALEDALAAQNAPATVSDSVSAPGPSQTDDDLAARPPSGIGPTSPGAWADGALAAFGLGAGLSPLLSAYYSVGVWVPIGLVLVVVATAAMIVRPPRYTLAAALALAGTAGLGVWSLISMSWADGAELAGISANLWFCYAAALAALIALISAAGRPRALLLGAGVGIAAVAISVLVRLLGSDPATLFLAGRLNAPLGYINGEGCVFALGACWTLALAERRQPATAALGAALTVVMACLALLSQSRGAAIATFGAVVVLIAVVPGRRRRIIVLAVIAAALAAAAPTVTRVYSAGAANALTGAIAHHAAAWIVVTAGAAGVVWGLLVAVTNLANRRGAVSHRTAGWAATGLAVVLVAAPLVAAAVRASSLRHAIRTQWHAFVHLSDQGSASATQTRLFTGAGNRYDYWRIAWHAFTAHPVAGLGAGNYPEAYFLHRRTIEAIQNPHSIELQVLSELGIVGALLLALLLAGVVLGVRRLARSASRSAEARTIMVAATGAIAVFLVDSSGDWMHLLPGVAAIALCAIAALCQEGPSVTMTRRQRAEPRARLRSLAAGTAAILVLAIAGASLLRAGVARRYLDDARAALPKAPATAIADAHQTLRVDDADLGAYYVQAAGQARFDEAAAARRTLLTAAAHAPGDYVTWVLLGDLESRAGHVSAARGYYLRALRLDPREPILRELVANPLSDLPAVGR